MQKSRKKLSQDLDLPQESQQSELKPEESQIKLKKSNEYKQYKQNRKQMYIYYKKSLKNWITQVYKKKNIFNKFVINSVVFNESQGGDLENLKEFSNVYVEKLTLDLKNNKDLGKDDLKEIKEVLIKEQEVEQVYIGI